MTVLGTSRHARRRDFGGITSLAKGQRRISGLRRHLHRSKCPNSGHRELTGAFCRGQRTEGQPLPIAANGGPSSMSFDRDSDGGTGAALEDAPDRIAEGEGSGFIDMIDNAPPGPIKTLEYDEACLAGRARSGICV